MLDCRMGYELIASPGPSNWPPLDQRALTTALEGIAVGHCAGDGGALRGNVWIDLLPDGKVGGLAFDGLTPDTKDVRACLGVAFGHVEVPPFRGGSHRERHSL